MSDLYRATRERFLISPYFDWVGMSVRLQAWSGPYTFIENHASNANVAATATLRATSLPLTNKNGSYGFARSDPAVLVAVPVGAPITFFTLCEYTGDLLNMGLIAYIDTGPSLPFTPNGLDWNVQPDWLVGRGWFRA